MRQDDIRHRVDRILVYIAEFGATQPCYSVASHDLKRDLKLSEAQLTDAVRTMVNLGYHGHGSPVGTISISAAGLARASDMAPHVAWQPPPPPPTTNTVNVYGTVQGTIQQAGSHSTQTGHFSASQDAAITELVAALRDLARQAPPHQAPIITGQAAALESARASGDKGTMVATLGTIAPVLNLLADLPVTKILEQVQALSALLQG